MIHRRIVGMVVVAQLVLLVNCVRVLAIEADDIVGAYYQTFTLYYTMDDDSHPVVEDLAWYNKEPVLYFAPNNVYVMYNRKTASRGPNKGNEVGVEEYGTYTISDGILSMTHRKIDGTLISYTADISFVNNYLIIDSAQPNGKITSHMLVPIK